MTPTKDAPSGAKSPSRESKRAGVARRLITDYLAGYKLHLAFAALAAVVVAATTSAS